MISFDLDMKERISENKTEPETVAYGRFRVALDEEASLFKELKQLEIEKSKARTQMDLAGITDRQRILNKYGDQISRTRYGSTGE